MRLFIAIVLAKDIRNKLADVQSALQKVQPDIKLVEPDNIHLTLRFLGEVAEDKLPEVARAISAVENHPAFELELKGLGAFPMAQQPKVVWVKGVDNSHTTEKVYNDLETALIKAGFPPDDHKFSIHITLGRNKTPKYTNEFQGMMDKYCLESFGKQAAQKVSLIRSTLTPAGPIYTNIRDFSLRK